MERHDGVGPECNAEDEDCACVDVISISPTLPGAATTENGSLTTSQCRPDGSTAECPGSAGKAARAHLDELADSVHCWQQARHSMLAFHALQQLATHAHSQHAFQQQQMQQQQQFTHQQFVAPADPLQGNNSNMAMEASPAGEVPLEG
eukprot:1721118-Amphidinium_carterae.2